MENQNLDTDQTPENEPTPAAPEAPPAETEPTPAAPEAPVATEAEPEPTPAAPAMPELTLGSGAPADEEAAPAHEPRIARGKLDKFGIAMGTGRRKTAVARVRIKPGSGKFSVNDRELEDYFPVERYRLTVQAPLRDTDNMGKYDIWVRVNGGGPTGQSGAIVLGIARALEVLNPNLHEALRGGGYLSRDSRMVERKKFGFKKARRSFQFSKR